LHVKSPEYILLETNEVAAMKAVGGAAAAILLLQGCATPIYRVQDLDFGPSPVDGQYQDAVRAELGRMLVDPESMRVRFSTPLRAYQTAGGIGGNRLVFTGYVIPVEMNARNRMGGYVGYAQWFCRYAYGLILDCVRGNVHAMQSFTIAP
jgi:hypothetical protein